MELKNISYLKYNDYYIFFDYVSDISSDISSDVTDSPIDAREGASLQDKRAVGMTSVGITAKFSNRSTSVVNTPSGGVNLFSNFNNNRLSLIANFLEYACENGLIFEVCKKGVIYKNQLLNDITFTFGEYYSTLEVSLSFIEIETVTAQVKYPTSTNTTTEDTNPSEESESESSTNSTLTAEAVVSKVVDVIVMTYNYLSKMFTRE